MIKWLKGLFESSETNSMVPISQFEVDEARNKREAQEIFEEEYEENFKAADELQASAEYVTEYMYMGDGMMEEVRVSREEARAMNSVQAKASSSAKVLPASTLKSRVQERRSQGYDAPTTVYAGSDYVSDSGSSCDSGSPSGSCD